MPPEYAMKRYQLARYSAADALNPTFTRFKVAPSRSFFRSGTGEPSAQFRVVWRCAVLTDLQTKLERYEAKAAHCTKAAQEATGERGRVFYEELARYYIELAADFRRVIAKQTAASMAAE